MGLPRSLAFCRIGTGGQTIDVFLDFLCPFSRKMAISLNDNVLPLITKGGAYEGKVQLLVRPYPQPFHYFSTFPVEAAVIFGQEHPELWWEYVLKAFAIQDDWFNGPAADKTPIQCQTAYATVAVEVAGAGGKGNVGSAEVGKFMDKLKVHEKSNGGSVAFADLKYLIREGRQNGIHVTPTVLINGLEDPSVSSSFVKKDWDELFKAKL